jgi:hypothetical protein
MCPSSSVDNPSMNIGIDFYIKKNKKKALINLLEIYSLDFSIEVP